MPILFILSGLFFLFSLIQIDSFEKILKLIPYLIFTIFLLLSFFCGNVILNGVCFNVFLLFNVFTLLCFVF